MKYLFAFRGSIKKCNDFVTCLKNTIPQRGLRCMGPIINLNIKICWMV